MLQRLSGIAFAVTLTVLAFFAYLFAEMQQDRWIMRCFGTRKAEVRFYLMTGTGLIALTAISAGTGRNRAC